MIQELDNTLRTTQGQLAHLSLVSAELVEFIEALKVRVDRAVRIMQNPHFQRAIVIGMISFITLVNLVRSRPRLRNKE